MQLKIQAFKFRKVRICEKNAETALLSSGTPDAGGPDSEKHDMFCMVVWPWGLLLLGQFRKGLLAFQP